MNEIVRVILLADLALIGALFAALTVVEFIIGLGLPARRTKESE